MVKLLISIQWKQFLFLFLVNKKIWKIFSKKLFQIQSVPPINPLSEFLKYTELKCYGPLCEVV